MLKKKQKKLKIEIDINRNREFSDFALNDSFHGNERVFHSFYKMSHGD